MEIPLLAAALIVKNEEVNLPDCLSALTALGPLMSEICVYDTGSTDRTIEIAEAAGARVERGYWDGDFARARNAALAMTDAKWVLTVDADERVRADVPALRRALVNGLTRNLTGVDSVMVAVLDVRDGMEVQTHSSHRVMRAGRTRWTEPVHERVVRMNGQDPSYTQPGRQVVCVEHIGYADTARVHDKLDRNRELADAAIRQAEALGPSATEELIKALIDRARSHAGRGEVEDALRDYRRVRTLPSGRTYRTAGLEAMAELLCDLGEVAEADSVLRDLRAERVARPQVCDWIEARICLAKGDTKRALALLRTIDVLGYALGIVAAPRVVLEARMNAAIAEGEHLEGAACLVNLMAAQGVVRRKYGDLLIKLSHELPEQGLLDLLVEHDRGNLARIADEFDLSVEPGPRLARELRKRMQDSGSRTVPAAPAGATFRR